MLGNDITVKFIALKNAATSNLKIPKDQVDTLDDTLDSKIIALLKIKSEITQMDIAKQIGVSTPSVKRVMKKLVDKGIITRKGGKRYGYWEVN